MGVEFSTQQVLLSLLVVVLVFSIKHHLTAAPDTHPGASDGQTLRNRRPIDVLYDPKVATVDIIAVHGLGSNVDRTWTWRHSEEPVPIKSTFIQEEILLA